MEPRTDRWCLWNQRASGGLARRLVLAVALTVTAVPSADATNVNNWGSVTLDGVSVPLDKPILRVVDAGAHTIVVTGLAARPGQAVRVELLGSGEVLQSVLVTPGPIDAGTPFTATLGFTCLEDTVVGANGVSSGEGTLSDPAELRIRDGTEVLPIDPDGKRDLYWSIACRNVREDFKLVQVLVDVLTNSPFNSPSDPAGRERRRAEIREMVEAASRILSTSANIGLIFTDGNVTFDEPDYGNNDGIVQVDADRNAADEYAHGRNAGSQRLRNAFAPRTASKGFKATLARGFTGAFGADTIGLATHDSSKPVAYLVPLENATAAERGQLFAHEFCHTFSLGAGHRIDGGRPYRWRADDGGHHPDDRGNLMYPLSPAGTELTPQQARQCNAGGKTRGILKQRVGDPVMFTPDTKQSSWLDPSGDVVVPQVDLLGGSLYAEGPDDNLDVVIEVVGGDRALPAASRFELLLDADDDASTGAAFGSFLGIDEVLTIEIEGLYPFTPPTGSISTTLLDVASGVLTPLAPGAVETLELLGDVPAPPDAPVGLHDNDAIRQSLALPFLTPLANEVPVGVRATDLATGATDEAASLFVFAGPPRPHLDMGPLEGLAGQTVALSGTAYPPSKPISIRLDETEVVRVIAGADGSFAAALPLPADLPPGNHFVTATDDTTASVDFSVYRVSRCAFDTDGDGDTDLELQDADKDGACEFPPRKTVVRGTLRIDRGHPVELSDTSTVEADAIVVDPEGRLTAAPGARKLTIVALTGDLRASGTVDLQVSDDVVLRANVGDVALRGPTTIVAGDTVTIDARQGDLELAPSLDAGGTFHVLGTRRVDLYARGPKGNIRIAGAKVGSRQLRLSTRSNVSVVGNKSIVVQASAMLTTDPVKTLLPGIAGNVEFDARGRIVVKGAAVVDSGRNLRVGTAVAGNDVCLGEEATLEARDVPGRLLLLDFLNVRGSVFNDGTARLIGVIRGKVVPGGPCMTPD